MKIKKFMRALGSAVALTLAFNTAAQAQPAIGKRPDRYAAIVTDARTGETIYARDPQQKLHPASTTKVMTIYLVFEALEKGAITMDQKLPVSWNAASQEATNLNMVSYRKGTKTVTNKQGKKVQKTIWHSNQTIESISVRDALLGLITHSANDAAVVLAEHLGGSVEGFARKMNAKAQELGMTNSTFANPNGLPDTRQRTTVEDMAKLSRAIIRDFPEDYGIFSTATFRFNGTTHRNTNPLLGKYPGADGIKTGWINASGSNLTASAVRDGERVIAVVFGAQGSVQRLSDIKMLMDYGFNHLPVRTAVATPEENKGIENNGQQAAKPTVTANNKQALAPKS